MTNPLAKRRAERSSSEGPARAAGEEAAGGADTPASASFDTPGATPRPSALPKADSSRQHVVPARAAKKSGTGEAGAGDELHGELAAGLSALPAAVGEAAGAAEAEEAAAAAAADKERAAADEAGAAAKAAAEAAAKEDEFEIVSDGAVTPDGHAPHTPEEHSEAEAEHPAAEQRAPADAAGGAEGGGGVRDKWKALEKKGGPALLPHAPSKADDTDVRFFGGMRFTKVPAAFAKHKENRKQELLKRGFEERISKSSKKLYYFQLATGKSFWTLPPEEAPSGGGGGEAAAPALPPGYEVRTSKSTGKPYYVHLASGKVSWTPPA
jgi:hypothetical protein